MKTLIPLSIRKFVRQIIGRQWGARHYDSPFFGFLWSLTNRDYKTENLVFKLPHEMMPMGFRSRFFFDAYEAPERKLCKKHLSKDDSILELGACIGVVSCLCNTLIKDSAKHVVVEANPALISWLEKNKSVNQANFKIEHGMLSKTSNGEFRIEKFIVSGSANTTTGKVVKIPVFDLETVCTNNGFIPSAIVMDIEGGEIDFISENRSWIKNHGEVKKFIIEMHPFIVSKDLIETSKTTLSELGFTCVESIGLVETWTRP